eukprot:UN12263
MDYSFHMTLLVGFLNSQHKLPANEQFEARTFKKIPFEYVSIF